MIEPTIVTFANEAYIPVARNWLAAIDAAGVSAPVRIIALDAATRDAFSAGRVLYRPCDAAHLANLWTFRISVLRALLAEVHWLIHSDADAVWMRDPLPIIADCATDMVFSQGTVWPPDVHARHGIVLCCGFFSLRNTGPVRRFMAQLEARVTLDRDDQVSVNRLMDEGGLEWAVEEPYTIPFRDTVFRASHRIIRSREDHPVSVSVLPHHLFPRLMDGSVSEVIVAHPLSPKTCADKIAVLSQLGLWR
ncbi:hypothetical protein ThidrDRAFT_4593 [Thiorhodococcus drewsii AZ1]|uniref:Nucleotide-diphospho-sugar transferase domain-containing protein n=1 Tax=Thiorhodococcus drewsii AZ1 TaxID=765913 RepID=G2E8H9_9GAMM|nr:putative nucleotide-diphospho-sugar transferase [Thiorhodococcus drewsii]EGV27594.1 hypothetical protein ThidrDRAFT_4593 [Thiorhodococcus drewsii AZ1]